MFIHLGGDVIIRSKEIIAILNHDVQELSTITSAYLEQEEKQKNVYDHFRRFCQINCDY